MNVFPCALANINADKREERQRAKIGFHDSRAELFNLIDF